MKILIGTPIIDKKMYCWDEWINALTTLVIPGGVDRIDVMIADTSDEENKVNNQVMLSKDKLCFDSITYVWISAEKPMDKVVEARELIKEYALANDYDVLFLLDSDVIVNPYTLVELMKECKEARIISGSYTFVNKDGFPSISAKYWVPTLKEYIDFPERLNDGKLHKVDLIGLGCCLLSSIAMELTHFRCERFPDGKLKKSEDMCFAEDCKLPIYVHTRITCKHKITENHWGDDA